MRRGSNVNMNSRFETLYKKLGIEPRILGKVPDEEIMQIDFQEINKNIKNEQKIMKQFIKKALF